MTEESASHPLLELVDVTQSYEAVEDSDAPTVLRDVSLTMNSGESLAIVGPSGCGKSTLLNIIGTLVSPTAGAYRFEGQDMTTQGDAALAQFRNESLGFIFQSHHLLPQCSALENVLIPTLAHADKAGRYAATGRGRELLERVGLGQRMAHRPGQLSGGECQRVAVVRALINQPRLVLADEPTGSLDEESADQLGELLADLNKSDGVTLITVTHSLTLASLMNRGLTLKRGGLEPWDGHE